MKSTQLKIKDYELTKLDGKPEKYVRVTVEYFIPFKIVKRPTTKGSKHLAIDIEFDPDCLDRYSRHIKNFISVEQKIESSSQ